MRRGSNVAGLAVVACRACVVAQVWCRSPSFNACSASGADVFREHLLPRRCPRWAVSPLLAQLAIAGAGGGIISGQAFQRGRQTSGGALRARGAFLAVCDRGVALFRRKSACGARLRCAGTRFAVAAGRAWHARLLSHRPGVRVECACWAWILGPESCAWEAVVALGAALRWGHGALQAVHTLGALRALGLGSETRAARVGARAARKLRAELGSCWTVVAGHAWFWSHLLPSCTGGAGLGSGALYAILRRGCVVGVGVGTCWAGLLLSRGRTSRAEMASCTLLGW